MEYDAFQWIEEWQEKNQTYMKIGTLPIRGWYMFVGKEDETFQEIFGRYSNIKDDEWFRCNRHKNKFYCAGDENKLYDILYEFYKFTNGNLVGYFENELATWIAQWYSSQCNGEWEKTYGVSIQFDKLNQWRVMFDLLYTEWEFADIPKKEVKISDKQWIKCEKQFACFVGMGDSKQLRKIINYFRNFIQHTPPHERDI